MSLRAFLSLQILEEFEMDSCYIFSKCLIEFTCEDTDPGAVCSVQFSSVAQSCPTFCDPMNCSTPGLPVHHHLPEFIQTQVHRVSDAIQPSHPLSFPSPPAPNPSQRTFVDKVMSLLFNMLSRLVITFLPRSRHLLI